MLLFCCCALVLFQNLALTLLAASYICSKLVSVWNVCSTVQYWLCLLMGSIGNGKNKAGLPLKEPQLGCSDHCSLAPKGGWPVTHKPCGSMLSSIMLLQITWAAPCYVCSLCLCTGNESTRNGNLSLAELCQREHEQTIRGEKDPLTLLHVESRAMGRSCLGL